MRRVESRRVWQDCRWEVRRTGTLHAEVAGTRKVQVDMKRRVQVEAEVRR